MADPRLTLGQFEVFPGETQGFRLPFGYIPGKAYDPTEWVRFIRAYMDGTFSRVSWEQLVKRAENRQQRRARAAFRSAITEKASSGEERYEELASLEQRELRSGKGSIIDGGKPEDSGRGGGRRWNPDY